MSIKKIVNVLCILIFIIIIPTSVYAAATVKYTGTSVGLSASYNPDTNKITVKGKKTIHLEDWRYSGLDSNGNAVYEFKGAVDVDGLPTGGASYLIGTKSSPSSNGSRYWNRKASDHEVEWWYGDANVTTEVTSNDNIKSSAYSQFHDSEITYSAFGSDKGDKTQDYWRCGQEEHGHVGWTSNSKKGCYTKLTCKKTGKKHKHTSGCYALGCGKGEHIHNVLLCKSRKQVWAEPYWTKSVNATKKEKKWGSVYMSVTHKNHKNETFASCKAHSHAHYDAATKTTYDGHAHCGHTDCGTYGGQEHFNWGIHKGPEGQHLYDCHLAYGTVPKVDLGLDYVIKYATHTSAGSSATPNGQYKENTSIVVDVAADKGYHLTKFTSTGNTVEGNTTFNITDDTTVNTAAAANNYSVTYKKGSTNMPGNDLGPYTWTYDKDYTTAASNTYTGRSYSITPYANTPSNATNSVTGMPGTYSGNLSFNSWSTGSSTVAASSYAKHNLTTVNNGSVTLTAIWNSATISLGSPSLKGWTFKGWSTSSSAQSGNTSVKVEPATTAYTSSLYATWKANQYTIYYNGNNTTYNIYGDTQTTSYTGSTSSTAATYDSDVTLANNGFSRKGYKFKEWNTRSDGSGTSYSQGKYLTKPNFTSTDGGSFTLYAIWEPIRFTTKFTKGITNISGADVTVPTTGDYRYDETTPKALAGTTYTGRKYTINYFKNKPQDATHEVEFNTSKSVKDTVGNLTFKNWEYTKDDNTTSTVSSLGSTKNITATDGKQVLLTAKWNNYTEKFGTPYLHGWTYKGFSTTSGDSNQSTATPDVTVEPDTTEFKENRYASWEANRYYIDYNGNDTTYNVYGDKVTTKFTGTTATTTAYYDKTVKLATNGFSKVGYKFKEWNTKSDGSGDSYENGATLSKPNFTDLPWYNSYDTVDTHITLYAIWEPLRYTITFNSNDTSLANYNNPDSYKQKVTSKNDFRDTSTLVTEKVRFDQFFNINDCSFTRKNNLTLSNGILIKKGYNFIGWGRANNLKTPSTSNTTDKTLLKNGANIRNVMTPTADGNNVNLYALWYKDIALTFDMNGGKKSGSDANVVLKSTIYNDRYEYTFHIDNTNNTSTSNQDAQIGSIDSWGTIGAEGTNKVYTRKDSDGTQYRFLGWSTNPDALEPDTNMSVYDTAHRNSRYTIHDDTTLYAVWEPVLMAKLTFGNVLSEKKTTEWNTVSTYSSETELASEFKAGEQGLYIINLRGKSNKQVTVTFDSAVTNVYNNSFFSVHDSLNTNVEGDSSVLDYCNLNKKYEPVAGKLLNNTFYVPMYLGTQTYADVVGESSYKSGGYPISFVISQDSFYYQSVYHTKEVIKLNARIKLTDKSTTSGGGGGGGSPYPDPTPGDPGMSILDQLRTKMKIRIR